MPTTQLGPNLSGGIAQLIQALVSQNQLAQQGRIQSGLQADRFRFNQLQQNQQFAQQQQLLKQQSDISRQNKIREFEQNFQLLAQRQQARLATQNAAQQKAVPSIDKELNSRIKALQKRKEKDIRTFTRLKNQEVPDEQKKQHQELIDNLGRDIGRTNEKIKALTSQGLSSKTISQGTLDEVQPTFTGSQTLNQITNTFVRERTLGGFTSVVEELRKLKTPEGKKFYSDRGADPESATAILESQMKRVKEALSDLLDIEDGLNDREVSVEGSAVQLARIGVILYGDPSAFLEGVNLKEDITRDPETKQIIDVSGAGTPFLAEVVNGTGLFEADPLAGTRNIPETIASAEEFGLLNKVPEVTQ